MNTNQLKRFAQDARRKLLEQVGAKLELVFSTDSAELREKTREQAQETLQNLRNKTMEHPWMAAMLASEDSRDTAIANLQQFLSIIWNLSLKTHQV